MAKNSLVINVDIRETRVALIENGIIAELHLERHTAQGILGNVYLGKVSRVLPGMQAAFIDIGEERAAFLHVEDLIRPDDLEAYLAGKKGSADDHKHGLDAENQADAPADEAPAPAALPQATAEAAPAAPTEDDDDDENAPLAPGVEMNAAAESHVGAPEPSTLGDAGGALDASWDEEEEDDDDEVASADAAADDDDDADDADDDDDDAPEVTVEAAPESDGDDAAADDADEDDDADDIEDDLPRVEMMAAAPADLGEAGADIAPLATVAEGEAGVDGSPEDAAGKSAPRARSRRGGRGRRRSGKTSDRREIPPAAAAPAAPAPAAPRERSERGRGDGRRGRDDRKGRGGRGERSSGDKRRGSGGDARGQDRRRGRNDPLRVAKSTPIREVVREGQEVIVQVSKEPIGTKGARVTSHISLPGRYVVYLPTVEHVGVSKRIGNDKERQRLREAIDAMKPPTGGLIVRTLAEGLTKKSLKSDVGYLVRLWGEIVKKREQTQRAPEVLYAELDLVLKTARDLFTDDVDEIVIDDKEEYYRLKRFVEMFMPDRVDAIKLYEGDEPIFDAYGIEDEIGRALARKVPLPSGGYLIIDQAEALTAIDVNTGRYVGKGSKDLEDTILATNLEAVEEIAYQLRFRNIGGLIILDLIDMEKLGNREKVRRRLDDLLAKDKAKTTVNRISDLGLIEMTRKRTRESLARQINEPCFYCDGTGNLQSKQTVAYEILRQLKREKQSLRGYSVLVNAHPAVVDLLKNEERPALQEAERRYQRRIELVARREYHLEQFDLTGK